MYNYLSDFHNKYPIPQILCDILHLISQDYELLNDLFQKKPLYAFSILRRVVMGERPFYLYI